MASKSHPTITGGDSQFDPVVGGVFTGWNGYLCGSFLDVQPLNWILMEWRTSEFPDDAPNSILDLIFKDKRAETLILLTQTKLLDDLGEQYRKGWFDSYPDSLCKHFSKTNRTGCDHE
jgi:hypothetical protein